MTGHKMAELIHPVLPIRAHAYAQDCVFHLAVTYTSPNTRAHTCDHIHTFTLIWHTFILTLLRVPCPCSPKFACVGSTHLTLSGFSAGSTSGKLTATASPSLRTSTHSSSSSSSSS